MTEQVLAEILTKYKDTYLGEDYVTLGAVKILSPVATDDKVGETPTIEISLPYPMAIAREVIGKKLTEHFHQHKVEKVNITFKQEIVSLNPRPQTKHQTPQLQQVKNIIAVSSGKGGVGKSTISFFLAKSLSQLGAKVGLLDADIYGPSQPHLLQSKADMQSIVGKDNTMNPIMSAGIKTMSLRYLLDDNKTPAIWRGAMASNALQQMVFSTNWGELDYLIVDMPPGTGDIQLTLCQRVALSAAIIVTTPHQLAVIGAEKGIEMFNKLYVPILGVIENMSYYVCPGCSEKHYPFGRGNSKKLIEEAGILAELPISADYNDGSQPPDSTTKTWQDLSFSICLELSKLSINKVPEILVAND
ncbi:MAG: Mrp/NBP35 family ATP-binding protein [Candidatus Portiera sp.]|nr:Mrp/NBP35 family ATP-binding protein [Portiera sp.]